MVALAQVNEYLCCVSIQLNMQLLNGLVSGESNDWIDGGVRETCRDLVNIRGHCEELKVATTINKSER